MDIPRFLQDYQMRGEGGFNLSNYSVSPGNTIRPQRHDGKPSGPANQKQMPGNLALSPAQREEAERQIRGEKALRKSDEGVDKKFFGKGLPHHHEIGFSAPNRENAPSSSSSFLPLSFNLI